MNDTKGSVELLTVWIIATLLVVGAVGASALWISGFDFTAKYGEPLVVEYNSETANDEWVEVDEFPTKATSQTINLTYRNCHSHIKITNNGDEDVNITANFEPIVEDRLSPEHLGFTLLNGIVEPEEARWEGNEAEYKNQTSEVIWGGFEKVISFEGGETKTYTLITVLKDNAPINGDKTDLKISLDFFRNDPGPDPSYSDVERSPKPDIAAGGPDIYNITPISILVSILGSAFIGYILLRRIEKEVPDRGGG